MFDLSYNNLSYYQIFWESNFFSFGFFLFITISTLLFIVITGGMLGLLTHKNHEQTLDKKKTLIFLFFFYVFIFIFSGILTLNDGEVKKGGKFYTSYVYFLLSSQELRGQDVIELYKKHKKNELNQEHYSLAFISAVEEIVDFYDIYFELNNIQKGIVLKHKQMLFDSGVFYSLKRLSYIPLFFQEDINELWNLLQLITQDEKIETYEYNHFVYKVNEKYDNYIDNNNLKEKDKLKTTEDFKKEELINKIDFNFKETINKIKTKKHIPGVNNE